MFWIFVGAKAIIATSLAFAAVFIFKGNRAPQLAFFVWLAVLGVLILPPVIRLPVIHLATPAADYPAVPENDLPENDDSENDDSSPVTVPHNPVISSSSKNLRHFSAPSAIADQGGPEHLSVNNGRTSIETAPVKPNSRWQSAERRRKEAGIPMPRESKPMRWIGAALIAIWAVGFFVLIGRQVIASRVLVRLLRLTEKAPSPLQNRCRKIAESLGLKKRPDLVTADGAFSPFLWHPPLAYANFMTPTFMNTTTAKIVIPEQLIERLSSQSLDAILTHELIHYRRRDSIRRYLEFLVAAIWWWLPTSWIARRRLRELEELCADAEVVRKDPSLVKPYATALLDTEEFLADKLFAKKKISRQFQLVPTFTDHHLLKVRIEMLTRNEVRRTNQLATRIQAFSICLILLPIGLLTAGTVDEPSAQKQETASQKQETASPPQAPADPQSPIPHQSSVPPVSEIPPTPQVDSAKPIDPELPVRPELPVAPELVVDPESPIDPELPIRPETPR